MNESDSSAVRGPFPLLPLRSGMLFPGATLSLPVGRMRSVAMLDTLRVGDLLVVGAQRDAATSDPGADDLVGMGTVARIRGLDRTRDRGYRLHIEGVERFSMTSLIRTDPWWLAEGVSLSDTHDDADLAEPQAQALRDLVRDVAARNGGALSTVDLDGATPGRLADLVAANLGLTPDKELRVLSELDVLSRLSLVSALVEESRTVADLRAKVDHDVRKEVNKHQRDALIREQIRSLKKELGEDDKDDELGTLRKRLDDAGLTPEARAVADRELRRLEGMNAQQAEANVIRTYLEWIADLPWSKRAEAKDDLDAVTAKLDDDHAGLEDVKKRILEHMAVLKLAPEAKGTILCLVGPPGVGKTSIAQSIADATGRPFVRIALGGVRDEAEVRGHRRTYVGALPGRVLHGMRKAKVTNPVVLLDEIDKLSQGFMGSPEAALLEVLDPEQNRTFTDHYLEVPYDLSEAFFLCTANSLDTLSGPLRDRLEIIEIQGYTAEEKVSIARRHLIPKQLKAHGISEEALTVTDDAIRRILKDYTREAGVRQLQREITRLCRGLALRIARSDDPAAATLAVSDASVEEHLGKAKYHSEVAERLAYAGVATGLAWTPVGGDILFIETSRMPGKGHVEITGQLGDVMKESARAALTYVRSHALELGIEPEFLATQDMHIHVPAGAVPKDGPSAGVTMFTALTSLLTGRRVRSDTAMTGEATLRGRVMPVGGIKAKVLAAHRAGITRVILPSRNARDIDDVPETVRAAMEFVLAEDMSQVLANALEAKGSDPVGVSISESATSPDGALHVKG
ncbi:MAG: endopeptidase La [Polyangiales bacterium]